MGINVYADAIIKSMDELEESKESPSNEIKMKISTDENPSNLYPKNKKNKEYANLTVVKNKNLKKIKKATQCARDGKWDYISSIIFLSFSIFQK